MTMISLMQPINIFLELYDFIRQTILTMVLDAALRRYQELEDYQ